VNNQPFLSRRNLRVKVMQILFAHNQDGHSRDYASLEKKLMANIRDTARAYLYHFLFFVEVADSVEREAVIRAAKYLPTEKDLSFSRRFYENALAVALRADDRFRKTVEREKLRFLLDEELVRLAYNGLKALPEYEIYGLSNPGDTEADRAIALRLFEEMVWPSDDLDQHFEDSFPTWDEDVDIIIPRVLHTIKSWKPGQPGAWGDDLFDLPQESRDFVCELLRLGLDKEEELEKLVAPRLENWEMDRVSLMDRILIRMALTELLYCDTIPIKVSINEYIDISKTYSTPRSKDFINGVLDNLMKTLREDGKIRKRGRGLVE